LLVNNAGAPMVIIRTGFWGKDFGNNLKYYETLKQLVMKLKDLTEPSYFDRYIKDKSTPQFHMSDLEEKIKQIGNRKYVLDKIEKVGWQFPRYHLATFPKTIDGLDAFMRDWVRSINELLDDELQNHDVNFLIEEIVSLEGKQLRQSTSLSVPNDIAEDADWFNRIDNTHRAKAWSRALLGIDFMDGVLKQNALVGELVKQAKEISDAFYSFNPMLNTEARVARASSTLGTFVTNLLKVSHLIELHRSAEMLLTRHLDESIKVLKWTQEELEVIRNVVGSTPTTSINAADLSVILDQLSKKNWLRLLRDAVRKGDRELFFKEVLRGAFGLTENGLRTVLGLPPTAEITDITNALATEMGRMVDSVNNKVHEAPWWSATPPSERLNY